MADTLRARVIEAVDAAAADYPAIRDAALCSELATAEALERLTRSTLPAIRIVARAWAAHRADPVLAERVWASFPAEADIAGRHIVAGPPSAERQAWRLVQRVGEPVLPFVGEILFKGSADVEPWWLDACADALSQLPGRRARRLVVDLLAVTGDPGLRALLMEVARRIHDARLIAMLGGVTRRVEDPEHRHELETLATWLASSSSFELPTSVDDLPAFED